MKATLSSLAHSLLSVDSLNLSHGTMLHITDFPRWNPVMDSIYSHPGGLILRRGNFFDLNGLLIYHGDWQHVFRHPKGAIIVTPLGAWLNGGDQVEPGCVNPSYRFSYLSAVDSDGVLKFEGIEVPKVEVDQWEPHHCGFLIRKGSSLSILIITEREKKPNS